jgi:hypothetical protein
MKVEHGARVVPWCRGFVSKEKRVEGWPLKIHEYFSFACVELYLYTRTHTHTCAQRCSEHLCRWINQPSSTQDGEARTANMKRRTSRPRHSLERTR